MNTGRGGTRYGGADFSTPPDTTIRHLEQLPEVPASLATDARQLHPAPLPGRIVVYLDPPYQGTTGYGHDLNRDEVVTLAMRWVDAGADVYISEAERIQIPGWHHVDITGCRRGQKRTFSKQQKEWVSCSRRPHWSPASQVALW
jgi:16S rRNA G966 N2-methylase RsmD